MSLKPEKYWPGLKTLMINSLFFTGILFFMIAAFYEPNIDDPNTGGVLLAAVICFVLLRVFLNTIRKRSK